MRDQDRTFFEPLWRRIALVILLLAWTAWEWSNGESLWGAITAGLTGYFIWAYLITFPAAQEVAGGGETSKRQSKE